MVHILASDFFKSLAHIISLYIRGYIFSTMVKKKKSYTSKFLDHFYLSLPNVFVKNKIYQCFCNFVTIPLRYTKCVRVWKLFLLYKKIMIHILNVKKRD